MNEQPDFCPYCGGNNVVETEDWEAHSGREVAIFTEWQCRDCAKSFWI